MLQGFDTSHFQGGVTDAMFQGKQFWSFKVTQGTTYVDPKFKDDYNFAVANFPDVVRVGYHVVQFGLGVVQETDWFLSHFTPNPGETTMLDVEQTLIAGATDPVNYVLGIAQNIGDKTGKAPFAYMDISVANAYDWSPVIDYCGLWLAAPSYTTQQNAPVKYEYVMQQLTTTEYGGVAVDQDVFFGTMEALRQYTVQPPAATLSPTPNPQPSVPPTSLESPVISTVPQTTESTSSVSTPSAAPITTVSTAKTSSSPPTTPLAIDIVKPKRSSKPLLASTKSEVVVVENDIKKDEDTAVKIINFLKGKKTYSVGTLMLITSAEKYFTGDHTLSQYLTTVQGLMGGNGMSVIALRAAVAKLD